MPIIEVRGVSKHFGGIDAVVDVSFDLRQDEILEPDFIRIGVAERREDLGHQPVKVLGADGIEIVLSVAAGFNEACDAEQRQVMADGRLARNAEGIFKKPADAH